MLPPKRLSLLLAATLFVSSLALIAGTYNFGETKASAQMLQSKLLRRHDRTRLTPTAAESDSLRSQVQSKEERELEDTIPKHVPIKIKIRSDKERAFKDIENEKWLRDFELEVTNTSGKPIYFLELWVVLPQIISENGRVIGVPLRYGRIEFVQFNTLAQPTDLPIAPGQVFTFTIPENFQKGWEAHKNRESRLDPKKIQIKFVQLSFGDGTGFNGTHAKPYPYKRDQSSTAPCREGPIQLDDHRDKALSLDARNGFPELIKDYLFSSKPAEFLPVNFSVAKISFSRSAEPAPQSGLCCPGTQCYFHKNSTYSCSCQVARDTRSTSCSDPEGACSIDEFIDTWCTDLGVACPEWTVGPCETLAPTPTPSPSPSPSPSPTPSPTPTPCPAGSFDPDPNGNCPYYSDKINGCCVCQQRNPECSGYAPDCIWVEHLCDCYNMYGRCGDPTPTPTPGGGGDPGGGTDPNTNPAIYKRECVDYYWVHFVSYDGGQTWYYNDNETYAGCFYEY
jgi:hypothetical protein